MIPSILRMTEPSESLAAEAIRLHRRYLIEIVEECGFCPWAKRARIDGRIRQHVSMADADEAAITETQQAISRWTLEPDVEVGFMIFPRLAIKRVDFDALGGQVNARESARHPIGEVPFVLAAFHPDARPDTITGERLIPFLRRTPDPCLQLIRVKVLDAVRANTPQGTRLMDLEEIMKSNFVLREEIPLRERIAKQNLATAKEMGLDALAAKLDDILADRNRTYAGLP
jgi:hypothetical protein